MNTQPAVSRRSFLTTGVVATTAMALSAESYARVIGANDRIGIGFVGAGGMGTNHLNACNKLKNQDNLQFFGVADCWKTRAEQGAAILKTDAVTDYHQLLDRKEIDYVTVATPEHRHAQIVLDALDAGKAVYSEKPLTHKIEEAQAVVKKQKETGLPLQVGVQSTSDACYASAGKAIAEGIIGRVVQAQIEYVRRYDKAGPWRNPNLDPKMPKPADFSVPIDRNHSEPLRMIDGTLAIDSTLFTTVGRA